MKKSGAGWALLATYIIAYDYWAIKTQRETLSAAFGRALGHPITRFPTLVVVGAVAKHLLVPNVAPQVDPINRIADWWRDG